MAYLAIRKVKGRYYAYQQESYREGSKVRTRTLAYLGAVDQRAAQSVKETRQKLARMDIKATVRDASQMTGAVLDAAKPEPTASRPPVKPLPERLQKMMVNGQMATVDIITGELIGFDTPQKVITTKKQTEPQPKTNRPFAQALKMPRDLHTHKLNRAAIAGVHAKFGNRLKTLRVNPSTMPDITIKYGHPDSIKRNRKGAYIVTTSRNPKRAHTLNKTRFWQNYRLALGHATLDALNDQRPEIFQELRNNLSKEHKEGKAALLRVYQHTKTGREKLKLSLQLLLWNSLPAPRRKTDHETAALSMGQMSFRTVNNWQDEAALILAEAHKLGWSGLSDKVQKLDKKHTRKMAKIEAEIQQLSLADIVAGKRRKLTRDLNAEKANRNAVNSLANRILTIKNTVERV